MTEYFVSYLIRLSQFDIPWPGEGSSMSFIIEFKSSVFISGWRRYGFVESLKGSILYSPHSYSVNYQTSYFEASHQALLPPAEVLFALQILQSVRE